MNHILRAAIVSLLLVMLPTAMANMQIIQGPSAMASSTGATALGGKLLVTDPTGDAKDGGYYALLGLNAYSTVPVGSIGYAYVNMANQGDSFTKTIDLQPGDNHGDMVRFDMSYTGSVSANVEKTVTAGTATAYAGIGSGVADFAMTPVANDCLDGMLGGSGMLALLDLTNGAVGNAGAAGSAMFNIEKLGDPVMGPNGLASDEVLRTYGSVMGEAVIAGNGQLINGAPAAQNNVFGVASLGTATMAVDYALPAPAPWEGAALSASGMGTVTTALTNLPDNVTFPNRNDGSIAASVAGEAVGGAWDGSTPIGTTEMKNVNDNVRTVTSGSVNSVANTYLFGDSAGSLSLLGDVAFHSNSPIVLPIGMKEAINKELLGELEGQTGMDYDPIIGLIKEVEPKVNEVTGGAEEIFKAAGKENELDMLLDQFIPEIKFIQEGGRIVPMDDPIVAADIAVTGAVAIRNQMGTYSSPVLTAEAFINDADTNAVARMGDRSVLASQENLNMGSGAHLRSHVDTVGSLGLGIQAAGQSWSVLPVQSPELHANVGIYGAATFGPTADGDRWDDAGTLINFDEGLMDSRKGTTPNSAYFRTDNGPLDFITWTEGSDFNPRWFGQNYQSVFEDNIAGSLVQVSGKADIPVYFETPAGRNSLWLSATAHGGIQ